MAQTDLLVFADWAGIDGPRLMGSLAALQSKGRMTYRFSYEKNWLNTATQFVIDPDLQWYSGPQYPQQKPGFGLFLDSMPDSWGRTLLKRKELVQAKEEGRAVRSLTEIDVLLGVFDASRMGGLRFKTEADGPFLGTSSNMPIPPWTSVRELQHSVWSLERPEESGEIKEWLAMLLAPGTSLGGARPKANVLDENQQLWIAKFPSRYDEIDKAAWEYLAHLLANKAGIDMAECRLQQVSGKHRTFFTKRFDRKNGKRVHFASAMTMTGNHEINLRDQAPSYLEIAEFIQFAGERITEDLHQLWRRIVFNIAISNTDDHLRNHGFILGRRGWQLSPAYDLNPSIGKNHLSLAINLENNGLDFDLARSVGPFFRLTSSEMNQIYQEVIAAISSWRQLANQLGIPRLEQELMASAFRVK